MNIASLKSKVIALNGNDEINDLENQLKDFVRGGLALIWQRQIMFIGAALLTGYFMTFRIAIPCYLFALATEIFDIHIAKQVMKWDGKGEKTAKRFLNLLTLSSTFSAIAVSLFVFLISEYEGYVTNFTPLFFLFSASLFAAMNNHQLLKVLIIRLIIYGITFIYIPLHDLILFYNSPHTSEMMISVPVEANLWLELLTVFFVMYFILDCSRIFFRLYRNGQMQKVAIELERDRAKQAYELQSQFVSVVSHELRTPLTSIKGGLGLIESGALGEVPPKIKNVTTIASKNSIRLGALINDLLDVQKFEFGKMDLGMDQVDLTTLVKESVEANESFNNVMNVTFKIYGVDTPVYVQADYNRLMQVMANIISNAVKFSNQDGVIEVTLESIGENARISIRDYGEGIPEGSDNKVFGQFSQVDSTKERKIGGTGLGMYITRKIMDGHKGSIDYTSQLGKGTTFFIDIPLSEVSTQIELIAV